VRGASAIGRVLSEIPGAPVRVFLVWEPVLWTDTFRPKDRSLVRKLPDARADHYWDPTKSLSAEILRAPWTRKYEVRGGPMGVVWDWVAAYPAGVTWDAHFPEPVRNEYPVVDGIDRVRAWLAGEVGRPSPG
jgi:hypothetical protein